MALTSTNFIPQSLYPLGYDTDYTLFNVYNTTQSIIVSPNEAWSETIYILPQLATKPEVWSTNGYATLDGELLYYGSVGIDYATGHVNELKNCIRNLGGTPTHFNPAGTPIYGNVVAEHHNQIARAIVNIENYTRVLDSKILDAEVSDTSTVADDNGCPAVNFDVTILSVDSKIGTIISYNLIIVGNYNSFTINFNDGTFTSTQLNGTHIYPVGAMVDPIAQVVANNCTKIATSRQRNTYTDPSPATTDNTFPIPIPECPPFPDFNFPVCDVPVVQINIPGPTFPNFSCPTPIPSIILPSVFNIGGAGIGVSLAVAVDLRVPSALYFQAIGIPSVISFTNPNIPSVIAINDINVIVPSIPPIQVESNIPPITINWEGVPSINVNIPSIPPISFADIPEFPPIVVKTCFSPISVVLVNNGAIPPAIPLIYTGGAIPIQWGSPPPLTVNVNCQGGGGTAAAAAARAAADPASTSVGSTSVGSTDSSPNVASFNSRKAFVDGLDAESSSPFAPSQEQENLTSEMNVTYESVGIPSVITLTSPTFSDISVKHDIPKVISVEMSSAPVKFEWAEPLPSTIKLEHNIPETIKLIGLDIPSKIVIEGMSIPSVIRIKSDINIPSVISFDASNIPTSISVTGIPEFIDIRHNMPSVVELKMPDKPEIEMVYKGSPIELKVELDYKKFIGEDDDEQPCFAIIPCASKRKGSSS